MFGGLRGLCVFILFLSFPSQGWAREILGNEGTFVFSPAESRCRAGKPLVYSSGLMLAGYGILAAAGEVDKPSGRVFKETWKDWPRNDDSPPVYNYLLHPLWGSETYLRAREAGFGVWGSVGFSMAMSVTWEYIVESWSEHPSTEDLLITTGVGWILGEARYKAKEKTDGRFDMILDPIDTVFNRVYLIFKRDGRDKLEPLAAAYWRF